MSLEGPYSHSRLECFRKCPLQFRLRYVDGIPGRWRSIESFMGNRVHESLEHLYQSASEGLAPPLPELIDYYAARWEAEFEPGVRCVRDDTSIDGYFATGKDCLTRYYNLHHPFADADRTLGLEWLVEFDLDGTDRYPIRGYVDRMVRGEDDYLEIHDYKTSRRQPPDRFFDDVQLALYQVGLGHAFDGQQGVRLIWHYLVPGTVVVREKSESALEEIRARTRRTIDVVRAARTFPAQPSKLCAWCEYRELCGPGRRHLENEGRRDEASLVWHWAQLKEAAQDPEVDREVLAKEAHLIKRNLVDLVTTERRTSATLEGDEGRLVVEESGGTWAVRLEDPAGA